MSMPGDRLGWTCTEIERIGRKGRACAWPRATAASLGSLPHLGPVDDLPRRVARSGDGGAKAEFELVDAAHREVVLSRSIDRHLRVRDDDHGRARRIIDVAGPQSCESQAEVHFD